MIKKLIYFLIPFILVGCSVSQSTTQVGEVITESAEQKEYELGENLPVSRAIAAKMIALTFSDTNTIYSLDKEISFADVSENSWYYPYVNAVYYLGYMKGSEKGFLPNEPLTLNEAEILINNISNKTIEIKDQNKENAVSYRLWAQMFQTATEGEDFGLQEREVGIFATTEQGNMQPWKVSTSDGIFSYEGYAMDAYVDKTLSVITKENEIVALLDIKENTATFKNVYANSDDNKSTSITFEGGTRSFPLVETISNIGTVTLENGAIASYTPVEEKINDVIKLVNQKEIQLQERGKVPLNSDFKVYNITDGVAKVGVLSNLTTGSNKVTFYAKDNEIFAGVINGKASASNIRVAIGTTDHSSLIHENVILSASNGLTLKYGDNSEDVSEVNTQNLEDKYFEKGRLYVYPKVAGDLIYINSITRGDTTPKYEGYLEIEKRENGFVIVNEVDLEKYLTAVVPSEMPTAYGVEAAKVQAVSARSYAYNQLYANRYHEYGANVDDSTSSQVYNEYPPNLTSITAVMETNGELLKYNGAVINANFFANSSGSFANSGEVWAGDSGKLFPAPTSEYLQYHSSVDYDLSKEENMSKFIKDGNISSYDSWSNWFRWTINMTGEELSTTINKNIYSAWEKFPQLVKTKQSDGTFKTREIQSIGNVKDITVLKRGSGGNAMEVLVEGDSGTVILKTEYVIRTVLKPVNYNDGIISTVLKDGTVFSNYNLLPSGFFVAETTKNENGYIENIVFYGGGNGHGTGMSQNGVKGMVDEGFTYKEILDYFYKGTTVEK
ncbi:MAG: SpoIID/LytB domain-containing protein [Anaerotignaceae bacterium]